MSIPYPIFYIIIDFFDDFHKKNQKNCNKSKTLLTLQFKFNYCGKIILNIVPLPFSVEYVISPLK